MDVNDLNSRLERVYASINARFILDVEKHINLTQNVEGNRRFVEVFFNKNHDLAEDQNKVVVILHNLANLKDHLRRLMREKEKNPDDIEKEINDSVYLQILIDLVNSEKHGYPLTRPRSGKNPHIKIMNHALQISSEGEVPSTLSINHETGKVNLKGAGFKIVILASVLDGEGNFMFSFDEFVEKVLEKWEEIIQKYDLKLK